MVFLLQKSIQGTVIILAIMAVRALLIHKLPKRTFLALWAVAVFSLLVPFSLESRFSVYSLVGEREAIVSAAEETQARTQTIGKAGTGVLAEGENQSVKENSEKSMEGPAPGLEEGAESGAAMEGSRKEEKALWADKGGLAFLRDFPQSNLWLALWLAGFVLCAGYFGIAYFICRREFAVSLPVENKITEKWLIDHSLRRKIMIRQSGRIQAPLTYGIFSPVILMPKSTKWGCGEQQPEGNIFIPQELGLCLEHEFVHIKRFDAVTKLVLTAALCLHWFNPVVWGMYLLANRDLELSCDEAVVRTFGENTKSAYARTLIRMEESKSGLMPLCNNFSRNAIEERITAIMKMRKLTLLTGAAAAALVVGITLVFATSAAEKEDARADCIRDFLGSGYSREEREKLEEIWFEDYEDMTIADFQEKAWKMTDTPEYLELIERLSNTAVEYEQREEAKEEDRNAFWDYFYYVYEPLTAESWKTREFGDYIRKDLATEEHPDYPKADLEYFLALSVLRPEELTVKEYYDTRLGVKADLQAFWQEKPAEDFAEEAGMRIAIAGKIKEIISKRSSEKLQVSIDYYYNPLDSYHYFLDEGENKPDTEVMGVGGEEPYKEENERESRQYPYGTRADYASLLALKTEGYEDMSLEEFNEKILDWCNKNPEAMERTGTDAFNNDYQVELTEEEKRFAALTVQLSRWENAQKVASLQTGKQEEDPWWGGANYVESEDDMWCRLYFQFSYHISDKSMVTVGERDQCIAGMMERILKFWEETELEARVKLSEAEVADQFEAWAQECGSSQVTIMIDRERIRYESQDNREYGDKMVYLGTVSAEGTLRNYISAGDDGKGSKYFHMTVTNHTEKEISEFVYSMLAYDSEGRLLEIYWSFMDSEKPASYECTVTRKVRILPGETLDNEGGWSIMEAAWGPIDLDGYGTDYKVEYVLSCISQITFEDGTQWNNPAYEKWWEECSGKTMPYSAFGEYSRQEYEIYGPVMEN